MKRRGDVSRWGSTLQRCTRPGQACRRGRRANHGTRRHLRLLAYCPRRLRPAKDLLGPQVRRFGHPHQRHNERCARSSGFCPDTIIALSPDRPMKTPILICALLLAAPTSPSFREYRVEAAHSSIAFDIPFLGHPVHGRFDDIRGTIVYTPQDLVRSSVTIAIATSSINTGSKHRDEHLRSSDFFDAASYPTIFFTSRTIQRTPNGFVVSGPLTMHGVTRDVSIPFRELGAPTADPHGSSL